MSTSEAYLDIITGVERRWPPAYDLCIMQDCPNCGAGKMELCINPWRKMPRKIPCLLRMTQGYG